MTQNGWIAVIVGLLIIAAGAWWFTSGNQSAGNEAVIPAPQDTTSDTGAQVGVDVNVNTAPMTATVTYSGSSYSPQEVTIRKGGTVTWKNASGSNMWVASAQHPAHTAYSGTSRTEHCPDTSRTAFDQCVGGGDYSFTFTKTGTWGYHDHLNSSAFGKIVVVE
ncbi:MAG: plastocyanin/azurin family copper-binding protein [Patescibacteria group bacterium]